MAEVPPSGIPRPLRLALFLYAPTGGGATRRSLTLAEGFAARGHAVDLVLVSGAGALADMLPAGVRRVVLDSAAVRLAARIPWRSRRNQISASALALARWLDSERPDVLLSAANHVHLAALLATRLARRPAPLVLRVSSHLTRSHQGRSLFHRARLRVARRAYARASAVVAVSSGIAEDLLHHTALDPERVHVVPNPTFTPDLERKAREDPDHPWLAPGSPPLLLAVGRLSAAKDFPTLLRAFARARENRLLRLVILGEGRERASLEQLVRELGIGDDVALPGFAANPFAWMSRAACTVLSSAWEGSPGALIEAMACGCPVVSTDCPSGPAEILDGGTYGALVPVGNAEALAEAVLATLRTPIARDRLRARAAEFSVGKAADRYLEVLARAIETAGAQEVRTTWTGRHDTLRSSFTR